ncbi:ZapG family protein [bacterium endosymbiont of Pedicinus badii]|uniref:ZapG family protein n=1 Tax=bacterium endosymbiont of Pedicinus badii TaxID=1719126 RepID=UPI0009BAD823|nr:DUF1043 family protein [bacterium endosymbiont of Pedicinus badii]OQM34151.1 hypothetical protein AOQ89_02305 [bacterium endosymbiont of Pedicinus badii]
MKLIYSLSSFLLIFFLFFIIFYLKKKKYQNKKKREEIAKRNTQIEQCKEELIKYFLISSKILQNISKEQKKLYHHMEKTSKLLLQKKILEKNPFSQFYSELENDFYYFDTKKIQPIDYPEIKKRFFLKKGEKNNKTK